MKLLSEVKKLNQELEMEVQSAQAKDAFEDRLRTQQVDPIETLQQIALFAGAIIAVLKFVKIFTGEKGDEKIDKIISTLGFLNMVK